MSDRRDFAAFVAITVVGIAAVIGVLWVTGSLDHPSCPHGKTLVLLPVGKVLVPQCL